jgi:hypothetical protein
VETDLSKCSDGPLDTRLILRTRRFGRLTLSEHELVRTILFFSMWMRMELVTQARVERLRKVIDNLVADSTIVAALDGSVHNVVPVASRHRRAKLSVTG